MLSFRFVGWLRSRLRADVAQHGEVLGSVSMTDAAPVLVEGHIQHPVHLVLDPPVASDRPSELGCRERPAEYVVARLLLQFCPDAALGLESL